MYRESRAQKAKRQEIYYVMFGFALLAVAFIVIFYLIELRPHTPDDDAKHYIYGTVISSHEDGPENLRKQYADVRYKVHHAIYTQTIEDKLHHRSVHDTMILEVHPNKITIVGNRAGGVDYAR